MLTSPHGIDFSRLFSSFDIVSRQSVIVAVSGGSDSTALLLLLRDHLDRNAARTRLVAATVDHALRPESAREAADMGRLCAELGIAHRTLAWTGDKPETGIYAAGREARHDLLADMAAQEGADLVLTGHTADDQAETVLMRKARETDGSGGRGLAGLAPATLFDGRVWFARPLLPVRREALRLELRKRGIGWTDDPTNTNLRYERPRLRMKLREPGGEADFAEALATASRSALQRITLGREAAALISAHADLPVPGLLRLHPDLFRKMDSEAADYGLRILLAVTGGRVHLPDARRAGALFAWLASGEPGRAVLSRTLVERRKTGIFLLREARGLPEADAFHDGAIWDGRYRLLRSPGLVCKSGAKSEAQGAGGTMARPDVPASLQRMAASSRSVPAPGWIATPVVAPWARYLPSFDIAPARAVAGLIGAADFPEPPFRRHNESQA